MGRCKIVLSGILCLLFVEVAAQMPWQSELLSVANDGAITYQRDSHGFRLPDFSHAGYKGGGVALPEVQTVSTISPVKGDNTNIFRMLPTSF